MKIFAAYFQKNYSVTTLTDQNLRAHINILECTISWWVVKVMYTYIYYIDTIYACIHTAISCLVLLQQFFSLLFLLLHGTLVDHCCILIDLTGCCSQKICTLNTQSINWFDFKDLPLYIQSKLLHLIKHKQVPIYFSSFFSALIFQRFFLF